jgi:hypothetical protein
MLSQLVAKKNWGGNWAWWGLFFIGSMLHEDLTNSNAGTKVPSSPRRT